MDPKPADGGTVPVRAGAASIAGRVYDVETRAGVSGVKISGERIDDAKQTIPVQETDPTGHYVIEGLDKGGYTISCSGFSETYLLPGEDRVKTVTLDADSSATGIDFALEKAGILEGTVTVNGVVAANARLMTRHQAANGEPRLLGIQTDAEGRYWIGGLEQGGRRVTFILLRSEGGNIHRKIPVVIASGATTVADVEFYSGTAAIEGVVYQDENTPLAAYVEAHFYESGLVSSTQCDSRGCFRLEELPAEPVELLVYMDAKPDAPVRRRSIKLELAKGGTLRQDICLSATTVFCKVANLPENAFVVFIGALRGDVDLSNRSFEALYAAMQNRESFSVISPEGTGQITALEPGAYTVVAVSMPGHPSAAEALEGEALQEFISGVRITPPVIVTIQEYGQSLAVDLSF
ncbi:MAG TPA: hypothetical protein HPP83_10020 [Candidatus Hydrogenedentes bacterium]|nr:hypothetical protein [Candidatus Hydrogenedentota bacterium]